MRPGITDHAVERYQERVRPTLTLAQARVELFRLLSLGRVTTERPAWLKGHDTSRWLVVDGADGIAFPIVNGDLTTCLTRSAVGEEVRAHRREARLCRSAARKVKGRPVGKLKRDQRRDRRGDAAA